MAHGAGWRGASQIGVDIPCKMREITYASGAEGGYFTRNERPSPTFSEASVHSEVRGAAFGYFHWVDEVVGSNPTRGANRGSSDG